MGTQGNVDCEICLETLFNVLTVACKHYGFDINMHYVCKLQEDKKFSRECLYKIISHDSGLILHHIMRCIEIEIQ